MIVSLLSICFLWSAPDAGQVFFKDQTAAANLKFTHFNGMYGGYHLPEIMGGGVALLDYDLDGDLDVFLVQSALIGPDPDMKKVTHPLSTPPKDVLLRNDLTVDKNGKAHIKFVDVTAKSGIVSMGYGMGVASADVNNDGYPDLYVTNLKGNKFFLNNGDGTFSDHTAKSGTGDDRWSTSATFFDFDRDGDLDLFVANYVIYPQKEPKCYMPNSAPDYCGPQAYTPDRDRLYRNKGDGTFEDASRLLQTPNAFGPGLGVVATDANGDGWLDLYVANDGKENQLWLNQKGRFIDDAMMAGVAVNGAGAAEAGMGVAVGDHDGDGDEDLFVTHLMDETNTLYANEGGFYDDRTIPAGLGTPSRRYTAFGTYWFDADNDGWLDLITLNGAVSKQNAMPGMDEWESMLEPNQLFHNQKKGKYKEVRDPALFGHKYMSRGAAFGDLDNDGDSDLIITNTAGPARLLINQSTNNWLGLRLFNKKYNRDMLGTLVKIIPESGDPVWRRCRTDGSYVASHDPRVIIGLGSAKSVKKVEVTWPDGATESWDNPKINTYVTLNQGEGKK